MKPCSAPRPTLAELFFGFMRTSLSGFGGVLPWARRTIVEERRWLSAEEFTELLGLCQFLPGPNIVNVSICLGARYYGARGALVAVAGLMSAPLALMLALGALYTAYGHFPPVERAFRGVAAAAAGLVVAMGLKMAASRRLRSVMALWLFAAFAGIAIVRVPLALMLAVVVPLAIGTAWWRRR